MAFTELAKELFRLRTLEYEKGAETKIDYASTGENGVLYRLYMNETTDAGEEAGTLAGELARSMGLTSGRIANILKQLETKGYVVRSSGTSDRRRVYVELTEAGRTHIEEVYQGNLRDIERHLEKLGEEDAREYIRILGRLLETEEA